jgi:sigma-B regulation protein RsbU (phosphoserine phosphatase)
MERLRERLHHHFSQVYQELRLAVGLQRDFLPELSRPFGNLQFAAMYRPASWVSGDMFDVFRVDEEHTGVYVVDAVGHGMAASLLTMFVKRAVVPTHRIGDQCTVLSPSQVMSSLNEALADQSLPNCQFVTACYGLFHHLTRTFEYSRGGHPYPLRIGRDGRVTELQAGGVLLGLSKGEEFGVSRTVLDPGDKVLFYTDGVELCFQDPAGSALDARAFHGAFAALATLPIDRMMDELELRLNSQSSFSGPRDDLTIVGLEVLPT